MRDFEGCNVVITGGSSGIGLATARRLVERGAEVCLVGRRPDALDGAVAELGSRAWHVACDLGVPGEVDRLAEVVSARWEPVHGLVNNAGVAPMADIRATDLATWNHTFAVNVRGPFQLIRGLLPGLERAGGAIVNVSSTLAERAIPGMVAYNASKAALNQLTRSLALELAPAVRVNAVMPAVVDTPIHAARGMGPEDVAAMAPLHPLGRVGRPEDVAALIAFLLSEEAAWMTGAVVPIDGGMMAG
ncbi:MAG TPA: SDR family oxidoreductase [Acidobacteria bacterium]|nr:SDR family oxidoreductase [Acidobacteriota bacterium]